VEALRYPRETVTSPAVAKRDRNREHVWPLAPRDAIDVAKQLRKEIVGIEFLDDQLQKGSRPGELRGARGEQPHRTRANFFAPALGVELLFRPNGVFQKGV
jgi:hypothetical protein